MELREFFSKVGGDYDEVMSRLGKEERVVKYLLRFVESDPMADFDRALEANNIEECFRALHSIKGMCLNLGLGYLGKSSSLLCEEYRNGAPEKDVSEMISETKNDYEFCIETIRNMCSADNGQKAAINVPNDQIVRILKKLLENCENMFVDGIDSNIAELSKCVLPADLKECYEKLAKYADDVAITKIEEEAGIMLGKLNG